MVDAEDRPLVEHAQQDPVQVRAEARSVPKGFSTMTRASLAQPDLAELLHHQPEQDGRNGQIVGRPLGTAERLARGPGTWPDPCSRRRRSGAGPRACRTPPGRGRRASRGCPSPAPLAARYSQFALATPMTGVSRWPRLIIAWSDGKIFLYARSPVAPKNTRASELEWLIAGSLASPATLPPLSRGARRTRTASPRAACPRNRPGRAS